MSGGSDDDKKVIKGEPAGAAGSFDHAMAGEDVEDESLAREDAQRRAAEADMEVGIFDSVRDQTANPVEPVRLKGSDSFCFSCHKDVPCWNTCCYGTDITLTPVDILRLSERLYLRPAEFLAQYTAPALWDRANLPVAKLRMSGKEGAGPCVFLDEEKGCTVYEDRPVSCRYYPLGLASVKMKGHDQPEDFFFLVKEGHCKGHEEAKQQTVSEFRAEQGIDPYDELNRGWIEILMKMVSWVTVGGPFGKEPDKPVKQMFFMMSTDVDAFRRFVFETKFLKTYDLDDELVEAIRTSDEALLQLGFAWMKNVLFAEDTIAMKEPVLQAAIAKTRNETGT